MMKKLGYLTAARAACAALAVLIAAMVGCGQPGATAPADQGAAAGPGATEQKAPEDQALPADGVVAIYFHSNERCATCKTIEACARKAVQGGGFAGEIKEGRLHWRVFNYDVPANEHFKKDYAVVTPMVVFARRAGGKDVASATLDEVWPLVVQGKKDECTAYLAKELRAFLDRPAAGTDDNKEKGKE